MINRDESKDVRCLFTKLGMFAEIWQGSLSTEESLSPGHPDLYAADYFTN